MQIRTPFAIPRPSTRLAAGPKGRVLCPLLLLAFISGCHPTVPVTPTPPPVLSSTTHYLGTPLSGPRADPAPTALPADALAVQVTIMSLDEIPAGGAPLGRVSRLVSAMHGTATVLPSSKLTRSARVAPLPDSASFARVFGSRGHAATLLTGRGVVPAGATAAFKVAEQMPRDDKATGRIWRRGVEVDVFRPADTGNIPSGSVELALAVDDFAQPDRVETGVEAPTIPTVPSPQHEIAIVDLPTTPAGQTIAFTIPFHLDGLTARAVAAVVSVGPAAGDPDRQKTVASCLADLRVSSAIAAARPSVGPSGIDEGSSFRVALLALQRPDRQRSTMIYLAGATGAPLSADAALVADDITLARVCADVVKQVTGPDMPDQALLGWLLDQTWLLDMGELLGNSKLMPELSAVLATYAGEVGRHPSSIEEVGKAARSHADFVSLLQAENRIFLEDSSPSSRVRALDWMRARGKAPEGYDPLGPPKQRRMALERFDLGLPPETQPATAPSTEPATRTGGAQ